MAKDDGGEAFPRPASRGNDYSTGEEDVVVDPQRGMSLRDYFAAKAMQQMTDVLIKELCNPLTASPKGTIRDMCGMAYTIADAMIEERKKVDA